MALINNTIQLEATLGQIAWAADALEGLRRDVDEQNARVFPVIAEAYISHIRAMTAEACASVEALRPEASLDLHLPAREEREKAA